jgi:hypothetical protein
MVRALKRTALIAIALLMIPMGGCTWVNFMVRIPDFDTAEVAGLWMWRFSTASGVYERTNRITFAGVTEQAGAESLKYEIRDQSDQLLGMTMTTEVARDAANADSVTLDLWYARFSPPGAYKVSTYNTAGESVLSQNTAQF